MHVLRHLHGQILFRHRQGTTIKQLVVHDAQREAIRFVVVTASLMPADVGCFQADVDMPQMCLETADRAPVFISAQHAVAEFRIPAPVSNHANIDR